MKIIILKENFSHLVVKEDAWLVYTKNRKCYVCEKYGVVFNNDKGIVTLSLHKKEAK